MSNKWRRFEVLLPTQFNDGVPVPHSWIGDAVLEIVRRFGAVSYESHDVHGHWEHEDVLYRDGHVKLVVDLPDLVKNRKWMKSFKNRWKKKLKQVELWMVSFRIDVE